ncbi:MAG: hypothetical protein OEV08_00910, partial [Nitrospira sp.]|nr:hypothetical protein [Nitrospira sp.]
MLCIRVMIVLVLGLPAIADAQEILQVPLTSARLSWDIPAPTPERSPARQHVVYCTDGNRVIVPMPASSVPMRDLVPGPGSYQCFVYAENTFGRQTEPDVAAPFVEVGYPAMGV